MRIPPKLLQLKELQAVKPPRVSFEFFPPKSIEAEEKLWQAVKKLEALQPDFVSVTYGAGGSTRERTHATVKRILDETTLKPAAHLTCVNASRDEIDAVAKTYWDIGVKHIVALRGDAPDMKDGGAYVPHPDGYAYAADLVRGLREVADFEISVAAYPEMHPQAQSMEADLRHLKEKIDAGATRAISQYFFDADDYFRFIEQTKKLGITVPIIAGILPIANFAQAQKFSAMCGATIPKWIIDLFESLPDDPAVVEMASVAVTTEICNKLIAGGVDDIHFYTLNRAELTQAVCALIGVK